MLKSFKLTPTVLFCFVVFLTFLAYSRSLHGPFVFDDHMYLDSSRLKSISQYLTLSRRSVSYLSFALNYHFSGMNVVAFRLTNIILSYCHCWSGFLSDLYYIELSRCQRYIRKARGQENTFVISHCLWPLFSHFTPYRLRQ